MAKSLDSNGGVIYCSLQNIPYYSVEGKYCRMDVAAITRIKNQFTVVLGGIEIGNLDLSKHALLLMKDELDRLKVPPPVGALKALFRIH